MGRTAHDSWRKPAHDSIWVGAVPQVSAPSVFHQLWGGKDATNPAASSVARDGGRLHCADDRARGHQLRGRQPAEKQRRDCAAQQKRGHLSKGQELLTASGRLQAGTASGRPPRPRRPTGTEGRPGYPGHPGAGRSGGAVGDRQQRRNCPATVRRNYRGQGSDRRVPRDLPRGGNRPPDSCHPGAGKRSDHARNRDRRALRGFRCLVRSGEYPEQRLRLHPVIDRYSAGSRVHGGADGAELNHGFSCREWSDDVGTARLSVRNWQQGSGLAPRSASDLTRS
jgi:hypothetical protein